MRKVTRLRWLKTFENKEASENGWPPSKEKPVVAYYNEGIPYRWSLWMTNGDIISINEHGNVCRIDYVDGGHNRLDNLFDEHDCLGGINRVDKRLGNIRDGIVKKARK